MNMKKILSLLIIWVFMVAIIVSCNSLPAEQKSLITLVRYEKETTLDINYHTNLENADKGLVEQATQEPTKKEYPEYADPPLVEFNIKDIPYFGNHEMFRLPAAHALAYAEAIRNADFNLDSRLYSLDRPISCDVLSVVLIDLVGDGVPLLLLAVRNYSVSWGYAHEFILFGFAGGELQQITDGITGIGFATVENEDLLSLVIWNDFGGDVSFHRVKNGAAELVSITRFVHDRHAGIYLIGSVFYIDDIKVSEEEFWFTKEGLSIVYLMQMDHPGTIHPTQIFANYLNHSFSREQAIQIFLYYAMNFQEMGCVDGD